LACVGYDVQTRKSPLGSGLSLVRLGNRAKFMTFGVTALRVVLINADRWTNNCE
jgi:hypothetical protein